MKLLIVLPTYNERPNIERVAEGILRHDFAHLMVVDDASPDGTGQIADALAAHHAGRIQVVHRQGPRGLGLAYIDDGLKRALQTDADAIGQMDADLSHDPIMPGCTAWRLLGWLSSSSTQFSSCFCDW